MPQRKNKAILIRTEEEVIQSFKKSISENKVSTYGEGLKCLVTIVGSEVFQQYQDCQFFSEYPPDSKHFIQCSRGKSGKRITRKREACQACAHNREIKVFMQSKGKIEQQNSELQHKLSKAQDNLRDVTTQIADETRKLEKIENLSKMPEVVRKRDKEIAELRDKNDYLANAYEELKEQVETLQTVPQSVLEVAKRLSEQKTLISPPQKVAASKATQTIQRVTEREKTEKERIVETVTADPFTNQEIECPLREQQYVDIIKECKKGCKDVYQCPFYQEINNGTVPLEAKIRERRLV